MSEMKEATEGEKRYAERDKMMAEIYKIGAETAKIQAETKWYPAIAMGAMGGTFLGVVVLIGLKFLHQT